MHRLVGVCFVLAGILCPSLLPVCGQSDFLLTVSDSIGLVDEIAPVDIGICNSGEDLEAISFGVCNDDLVIIDTVIAGISLDNDVLAIETIELLGEDGWTLAIVFDVDEGSVLESGDYPFLYDADYTMLDAGDSVVEFCDLDGVTVSVSTADADHTPDTEAGIIEVGEDAGTECDELLSCPDCSVLFDIAVIEAQFQSISGEGTVTVELSIEEDSANEGYPTDFAGFSMAIAHDDELLLADSAELIGPVTEINDGDGPDFVAECLDLPDEPGAIVAAIFSNFGQVFLKFEEATAVVELTYVTVADAFVDEELDVETDLLWEDTLSCNGSAVVRNVASNCRGTGYAAETTDATVTLTAILPSQFLRGDSDGNGIVFPIIDAIHILEYGFTGGPEPTCLDAADVDGNDIVFPILDGLYLLNYGFVGGLEPPDPGPFDCGPDESDGPGCEISSEGC